ncbi:MAG: polysaccharide biosynthesis tyrosine autokinase [Oscillospiraceae bacterium]|jgi:capsular exopolysaccharide synthesis family protein|nr:polysaccharide biosynthesis tyrosine autokinase [Oscillospiraceae bacterium]
MDEHKTGASSPVDFNPSLILHNFLQTAKRLLWLAVLAAMALGFYSYYTANKSYSPVYTVTAVFSVNAAYEATTDILSYSYYLDSNAAIQLAATFPYVISSETTSLLLRRELNMSYIPGRISASSIADAALFTLNVASSSPQLAFDLLDAVIKVYPQAASTILGDTQIQVIDRPLQPPTTPNNENTARQTGLIGGLGGFVLVLVCAFVLSLTRKTVHTSEDLRRLVNLPCLAYIPGVRVKKHSDKNKQSVSLLNTNLGAGFSEAVRNFRVKLQKALSAKGAKTILITSTLPGEGKTTAAMNLALSLSKDDQRVVLIDADLRKQSLKELLGIEQPSGGLLELLSGTAENFRLLPVPGSDLLLLCGDETTEQPQPLLDTPRMKHVLEVLREKVDYIIIDTPPAGILSDAATIAKYVDSVIYVVRQDLANSTQIVQSIQSLALIGIKITGCIINRTQAGTTRYGYGSKYGYGYGYGPKYGQEDRYSTYYTQERKRAKLSAQSLTDDINRAAR